MRICWPLCYTAFHRVAATLNMKTLKTVLCFTLCGSRFMKRCSSLPNKHNRVRRWCFPAQKFMMAFKQFIEKHQAHIHGTTGYHGYSHYITFPLDFHSDKVNVLIISPEVAKLSCCQSHKKNHVSVLGTCGSLTSRRRKGRNGRRAYRRTRTPGESPPQVSDVTSVLLRNRPPAFFWRLHF